MRMHRHVHGQVSQQLRSSRVSHHLWVSEQLTEHPEEAWVLQLSSP